MHEPDFLRLFVNRVRKRALDQDFATVNAALRVCEVIVKVCVSLSLFGFAVQLDSDISSSMVV
jgi:hypothetical protein